MSISQALPTSSSLSKRNTKNMIHVCVYNIHPKKCVTTIDTFGISSSKYLLFKGFMLYRKLFVNLCFF